MRVGERLSRWSRGVSGHVLVILPCWQSPDLAVIIVSIRSIISTYPEKVEEQLIGRERQRGGSMHCICASRVDPLSEQPPE